MSFTALGFLIASFLLFVGFMCFSIFNYKRRFTYKYDIRNTFPYELNYEGKFNDNFLGNLCLVLSSVLAIGFYIVFDGKHQNGYLIFILIAGIIGVICDFILVFLPLKHLRSHMALFVFSIAFGFLTPCAAALAAINEYKTHNDVMLLIFAVIGAIITIVIFAMIMNPKLSRWGNMKEVKNPNGTITYQRPKYFLLAFYEWCLFFLSFLTQIVVLVISNFIL